MRYGFCTGFATDPLFTIDSEMEAEIGGWGYDDIEYPMMGIAALSEKDFEALCKRRNAAGLGSSSMCNFLPASVPVTGPQASEQALRRYLDVAFERASRLGTKKLIFGSAGARRRETRTKAETDRQFLSALQVMDEYAGRYGIPVLIEAIRRGEADYINTLAEAAEILALAKAEGCGRIGLMADLFHMMSNEEPLSDLECFLPQLGHIHLCEMERALPDGAFSPYLKDALAILRQGNYDGTISFESVRPKSESEGKAALELLKNESKA